MMNHFISIKEPPQAFFGHQPMFQNVTLGICGGMVGLKDSPILLSGTVSDSTFVSRVLITLDVLRPPFARARQRTKLPFLAKVSMNLCPTLFAGDGFCPGPVALRAAKRLVRLAFGYIKRFSAGLTDVFLAVSWWHWLISLAFNRINILGVCQGNNPEYVEMSRKRIAGEMGMLVEISVNSP